VDLEFYCTADEGDQLLNWALGEGASLVPDEHYDEPHHVTITDITELADWSSTVQFFVVHPDWQLEPLCMRPYVHRTKGGGFYLSQRDGGPSIVVARYRARSTEDCPSTLAGGMIGTFPFYYSMPSSSRITPTAEFRRFSKRMADRIRRGGQCLRTGPRAWWFTSSAWAAVRLNPQQLPPALRAAASVALR
jgi:hypothetical protein